MRRWKRGVLLIDHHHWAVRAILFLPVLVIFVRLLKEIPSSSYYFALKFLVLNLLSNSHSHRCCYWKLFLLRVSASWTARLFPFPNRAGPVGHLLASAKIAIYLVQSPNNTFKQVATCLVSFRVLRSASSMSWMFLSVIWYRYTRSGVTETESCQGGSQTRDGRVFGFLCTI